MTVDDKKLSWLYWAPRILGIVFILFLAIFALDIFVPGQTISYYLVGLFMHLMPNFILAGILYVVWKYEKTGGVLFLLIGLFFTLFFRTYEALINFMIISFPLFLMSGLFLLHSTLSERRNGM